MTFRPEDIVPPGAKIKVIGVGGGGGNAVNTMIKSNIEGVDFITGNTDIQALRFALSPNKIQMGKELTKGLGAGADPDIGRDAALEDRHEIQEQVSGSDMVFVTAGMGGGTGTGGAAVVAQIARESGALTVGVVTKPFKFEGKRRRKHADIGIQKLREHVDTLIIIPNERLLEVADPGLSMVEAFKMADDVLVNAVKGISDIINVPGTVNVDFADVKTVMSSMGQALMGIGRAEGENRALLAAEQAISSPLLEDIDIEGATGLLINITAGSDISLLEVNTACEVIQEAAHEDANVIFGAVIDEALGDEIRITVIATGFPTEEVSTEEVTTARRNSLVNTTKEVISSSFGSHFPNQPRNPPHVPASLRGASAQPKAPVVQPVKASIVEPAPVSQQKPASTSTSTSTEAEAKPASTSTEAEAKPASTSTEAEVKNERTVETIVDPTISLEETLLETTSEAPEVNLNDFFEEEIFVDNAPSVHASPALHTEGAVGKPAFEPDPFITPKDVSKPKYIDSLLSGSEEKEKSAEASTQQYTDSPIDDFFTTESNTIADEIDSQINEALNMAKRVETEREDTDELEVPAFLRHGVNEVPIN